MDVVVLKVSSPTCFSIKEAPGIQMSQGGRDFVCMESNMEQYMGKQEPLSSTQPPDVGSILLLKKQTEMEWYRARVDKIVDLSSGYKVQVTLVDYGQTLLVDRKELCKVSSKKILEVPFQCIEFSLLGLRPLHRTLNEATTSIKNVPGDSWDASTTEYVKSAIERANSVQVQVLGRTVSGGLYGKLLLESKKKVTYLDEELVNMNYAIFDSEAGSGEILLEDKNSKHGTSNSGQHVTQKAVNTTTKSSGIEKELHQENTLAAMPESCDISACSPGTDKDVLSEVPLAEVPPLAFVCTIAASSPSQRPPALTSPYKETIVMDNTNVHAEEQKGLAPTLTYEVDSCIPTMDSTVNEGTEGGLDAGVTVCSTNDNEMQSGSGTDSLLGSEVQTPGSATKGHMETIIPSKMLLPQPCTPNLNNTEAGVDKACDLLVYRSAGPGAILLEAKQPTSESLTQLQPVKLLNGPNKKPVHDCQRASASKCMSSSCNHLSQASSKAAKLWNLLQKKEHTPSEAYLQSLGTTSKKPQIIEKMTNQAKSDETTAGETAVHGKAGGLTPSSSIDFPMSETPSHISSTKSWPPSKETTREKTVDKSIDYSDFMSPCNIVEEIVDPDLEEAKWNLKFDTAVPDLAAINVCQAPEDFRRHDFQSFTDVPADLDPYAQYKDTAYFGADFDSCKLPAQLVCSRVRAVCHGIRAPKPVTDLDQTPFDAPLKEHLCFLGFRSPSCIQSVVWPAVLTGRNVVAVAMPHTGKTLSYLIPLMSRLTVETDYQQLHPGCGPLMLVLTSTWQGAHRIYDQVNLLVEENKSPKCCMLYAGGSEAGKEIPIVNGCDILVATPRSFLRFLNNYERLIVNLYRCCHLVLDDGERLLDKFTVEVSAVVNEFLQCQKRRQSSLQISQIIVCSTMWTSGLNWFLHTYMVHQTPLVIFSSFSEAAIYAGVPTVTCYVDQLSQSDALLKILRANISRKVVVCAAVRETAIAAHQLLTSQGVYSLLLHDELPVTKISEVSSEWTSKHTKVDVPILVIQDKVLPLTSIRDAAVLVHYDIPKLSQFNFGFRYSCIADHMRSFRDKEDFYTPEGPMVHMILSSNNRGISVQLVEFLSRLGINIPDELAHLAEEEKMRLSSSTELPLCPNLKAFGHCERQSSENRCSYRHQILPEADHAPCWSYLPSQGNVRIAITKVKSASHFYAQILQQWNVTSESANGNKTEVELQETMSHISEYFSHPENLTPLDEKDLPTVGSVYGLGDSTGQFERVLVTSVASNTSASANVTVTHLDYGGQSTVSAARLFHLPQRLATLRPLAVEVYCCGVQPPDNDLSWTFQADSKAHSLFLRTELIGKIVLRLGNTLWLDQLVLQRKLQYANAQVSLRNVRSTLVKEGFACNNHLHVERLRKMAVDAGVTVPPLPAELEIQSSCNSGLDGAIKNPCTAHLDTMDYNHVYLWKATSPSHFYVQPCKSNSCLDDLERDIENAVRKKKLKRLKSVHTGALCITRCSNDGWYRGKVQKIISDEEVVVFFPDYGDSETCRLDEVLEPLSWMMLLPYQAILCSLAGIGPTSEEWSPKAQCVLEDFGYDSNNFNRILCLRVARKMVGDQLGTSCYEVFLFDSCSSNRICVSDVLVMQGLAIPTEPPELNFDISVPHGSSFQQDKVSQQSESDDDDDWATSDCKERLGEHVLNALNDVRNKVLSPIPQHSEEKTASKKKTTTVRRQDAVKAGLLLLDSHFKTESSRQPTVSWWQDRNFVHMDVFVTDVTDYKLSLTAATLHFRITTADCEFLVHEKLFAAIEPAQAKLTMKVKSLSVKLKKVKVGSKWKFLTRHKRRVPYIRYDLDHVGMSDNDDDIVIASKTCKDPSFTGCGFRGEVLHYDPVAHEERTMEIEAAKSMDEFFEEMYRNFDPNDIFEDLDF